jgi:hypothetical protein
MSGIPGTRRRWSLRTKLAKAERAGTGTSLRDYEVRELRKLLTATLPKDHVAVPREVLDEAAFLCARLRDLEGSLLDDDAGSDFNGHVAPSLARLEGLLAAVTQPSVGPRDE